MKSRIAFVTCYFNPCNYQKRLANYWEFLNKWDKRVPLITVQHRGVKLHQSVIYFEQGEPYIWQKERLLNLGAWQLLEYDYIGYVDADIILNDGWYSRLERLVELHPVVRNFTSPASQGLSWVFRRDFWTDIGLYERCVVGGADRYMYYGLLGQNIPRTTQYLKHDYNRWCEKYHKYSDGTFIAVGGNTIEQLPHGRLENRCYDTRHAKIKRFDSSFHVQTIVNGPLTWSQDCPGSIKDIVKNYFIERYEDDEGRRCCSSPIG